MAEIVLAVIFGIVGLVSLGFGSLGLIVRSHQRHKSVHPEGGEGWFIAVGVVLLVLAGWLL